ncbi:MAG: hypothetical protein Q7S86_04290 [bacterium]|nr:hypothetical protein [bacterium]
MKKFLKTIWWKGNASIRFSLTNPFALENRADDEGCRIVQRLRLVCSNPELLAFVLADSFFATVSDTIRLIDVGRNGVAISHGSLRRLETPRRRTLLRFALEHPQLCRETLVVFPEFFRGNPIVLVSNSGPPLLCSPPAEMIRGRPVRVMAVESKT